MNAWNSMILVIPFLLGSCAAVEPPAPSVTARSLRAPATSHGKYFGTAVVHGALFNTSQPELSRRYEEVLASQFNLIVPESEMKMASLWVAEQRIDFTKADQIADWAVAHGMKMRGHTLLWHRSLPPWLVEGFTAGEYAKDDVARLVEWYVAEVMSHYKTNYPGLVIAWDVVNEAIGPNDPTVSDSFGLRPQGADFLKSGEDFWRWTLGDDYPEKAFRWARAADPQAKLFYNDYHAEYPNPKGDAIYRFVTGMQARGVPIDGIGLQCHFDLAWLDRSFPGITFSNTAIAASVDRWIGAGLEVQVTEADIAMKPGEEARQAKLYADLLTATLLKTGVSAFVTWGFTDLVSWKESATPLYYDRKIEPKPARDSMLKVLDRWQ
jgi:endo-1,4-beta-xylanase